jgi:hypothetical protein
MTFDTPALIEMFRQSFSPLTQLSAGQLAMTHEQLQRQADIHDRMQQLQAQDQMTTARETALEKLRAEAAQTLEGLHGQNELTARMASEGLAQKANLQSQREARTAHELDQARTLVANLGLRGIDPKDPDYVDKVHAAAAEEMAKDRQAATEIDKQINAYSDQINSLAKDADVPEARQVAIAKSVMLGLAADDKQKAAIGKAKSLDDLQALAGDIPGAVEKIQTLIGNEERTRAGVFARKVAPLQARQTALQRTQDVFAKRGISPDYEALRANVAPDDEEATAAPHSKGLTAADVTNLVPQNGTNGANGTNTPVAAVAPAAPMAPPYSAVGLYQRLRGGGRAPAIANAASNTAMRVAAAPGQAIDEIARQSSRLWDGTVAPQGPIAMAGAGLGTLATGTAGEAIDAQRAKVAQVRQMIAALQTNPANAQTVRALRAALFAPDMDSAVSQAVNSGPAAPRLYGPGTPLVATP